MARYALNLPAQLKSDAEQLASRQGISLNQFIMWSVAEKVASLQNQVCDPRFPDITYRCGVSGIIVPVLRDSGVRVQALVHEIQHGQDLAKVAEEYDLTISQVLQAQHFFQAHAEEFNTHFSV